MVLTQTWRRGVMLAALCAVQATAALAAPAIPRVEPHLPAAAGTPCVVELFHAQPFGTTQYSYAPPPGCPGPWSKILLKADLRGSRGANVWRVGASLGGVSLFNSGVSQTPDVASWHVERDLTDYASLLRAPHNGRLNASARDNPYADGSSVTGSARLLFYRSTAATPARRVPDKVLQANHGLTLPHNVMRAYLDVTVRGDPLWFTCVPDASAARWPALLSVLAPGIHWSGIFPAPQGCTGGSFREVEVSVDGSPAGVVPMFPALTSDFNDAFRNAVDTPVPGVQSLNLMPYRVDLTPFAAVLSEAGAHTITLDGGAWHDAQLLLYLDRGSTHVTGAVTLNTLTPGVPVPLVTNTLARSGNTLRGRICTRVDRDLQIRGFVNTSSGRIESVVRQKGTFDNVQKFRLEGLTYETLQSYRQDLRITSTVDRHSRRTRGKVVLTDDREQIRYPLSFDYATLGEYDADGGDGPVAYLVGASTLVTQQRLVDATYQRRGRPPYSISLADTLYASHDWDGVSHSNWWSQRNYYFQDSAQSCYSRDVAGVDGGLAGSSSGGGCFGGVNRLRWFTRPDGSPAARLGQP